MNLFEVLIVLVVALGALTTPIAFAGTSSSQPHGPSPGTIDVPQTLSDDIGEQKERYPTLDREPKAARVFIVLLANISGACLTKCYLDVLQPGLLK